MTEYPQLPDQITIDGTTYYHVDSQHVKDNPNETSLYDITWVRFKTSDSKITGEPMLDGSKPSAERGNSWHIDGYLILHPRKQVQYFVYDKNKNPIPGIGGSDGFVGGTTVQVNEKLSEFTWNYNSEKYNQYFIGGATSEDGVIVKWYDAATDKEWNINDPVTKPLKLYAMLIPKGETPPEPTSFTLNLYKTSGDGNFSVEVPDANGLNGAEFELWNDDKLVDTLKPTFTSTSASGAANIFTPAVVENLQPGVIYRLVESKAPDGYTPMAEDIYFTVNGDTVSVWVGANGEEQTYPLDTGRVLPLNVYNAGGFQLPSTGGTGTLMYILSGGMLMMAAGIALVYKQSLRKGGREF